MVQPEPGADDLLAGARKGEVNPALISSLRTTLDDPLPGRRARKFITLMEAMRAEDAPSVRALFLEGDRRGRKYDAEWNAFWPRWGEVDGKGALESAAAEMASGGSGHGLGSAVNMAMESWAMADPAQAEAWLSGKPASEAEAWGLYPFIRGLTAADLAAATRYVADPARPPELKSRLFEQVTQSVLERSGTEAVKQWFGSLPDEPSRVAAFDHVLWREFEKDPAAARALLDANRDLPWRNQYKVLPNLVNALAEQDPAAVTQWAAALPGPPEGDDGVTMAVATGFNRWMETDPAAATGWLSAHQDAPWYNSAAYATAGRLLRNQDPGAKAWVESISDPRMRAKLESLEQTLTGAAVNP